MKKETKCLQCQKTTVFNMALFKNNQKPQCEHCGRMFKSTLASKLIIAFLLTVPILMTLGIGDFLVRSIVQATWICLLIAVINPIVERYE